MNNKDINEYSQGREDKANKHNETKTMQLKYIKKIIKRRISELDKYNRTK